jgi:hypothetical protein
MAEQKEKAPGIAQAIISELDHFHQQFKPTSETRTFEGQRQLLAEPCVAYAVNHALAALSVTSSR